MSWLWTEILKGAGQLAGALATLIGDFITKFLVLPVMKYIIMPVLQATLFHPYTLSTTGPGSTFGIVAYQVWQFMFAASVAVALAALAWGALSIHLNVMGGRQSSHGDVMDGLLTYFLVTFGGYTLLSTLLSVADGVTSGLLNTSNGLMQAIGYNPVTGFVTAGVTGVLLGFFAPMVLMVVAAFIAWVVFTWLSRLVDLIFYTGILPITAALAITGNKQAFQWNWAEAQGAVFSQLAMAVMWWVAMKLLGAPVPAGQSATSAYFLHLGLGIVALSMVATAPRMLSSITGHQHAGVASMALGVAAGSLLAGGVRSAVGMSKGGQFLKQQQEGQAAKAQAKVASWGQPGSSVGERFSNSPIGRRLGAASSAAMSFAAEKTGNVADTIGQSKAGQYAKGLAQTFATNTTVGVGLSSAARAAVPAVKRAAHAAAPAMGAARGAASAVLQPRVAMGRAMRMSMGETAEARASVSDSRVVSTFGVMQAHHSQGDAVERTAQTLGVDAGRVNTVMGFDPKGGSRGLSTRAQEEANFISAKHRQRHRPANGTY